MTSSYLGAVVDWPTFWFWLLTMATLTMSVMVVIALFVNDLVAKRSWLRFDPRAVQDPFSDG